MRLFSPARRLGLAFFAHYSLVGLTTPFWPLYLAYRGMSPEQVGVLMALIPWARFGSNIGLSQALARLGDPRTLMVRLSLALAIAYALFPTVSGFGSLLVLNLVVGTLFAPLSPLLDGLALAAARHGVVDYGPVRMWGSVAFIVAASLGGVWLVAQSDAWILWGLVGACILLAAVSRWAPKFEEPRARPGGSPGGVLRLLRRRDLRWLMLSSALLHGSHAVHYAFGSQTWREGGIPDPLIGWLWAEGTIFEVLLFWMGERVSRRCSPPVLLAISGVAGMVRWSVLATSSTLGPVVFGQALHSITFGCMHLGVMAYLRDRVDAYDIASASTLYGAIVSGLTMAVMFPISGWCFERFGLSSFALMAVVSAGGVLAAIGLGRARRAS